MDIKETGKLDKDKKKETSKTKTKTKGVQCHDDNGYERGEKKKKKNGPTVLVKLSNKFPYKR